MEQVKVKMLFTTHTATHGTLNEGAILRTDAAFAKHLVEDCGAAKYDVPAKETFAIVQPKPSAAPKARVPKKGTSAEAAAAEAAAAEAAAAEAAAAEAAAAEAAAAEAAAAEAAAAAIAEGASA
jgi:alcohol dehydrogenase YqhD (iron-dependent ADH family)